MIRRIAVLVSFALIAAACTASPKPTPSTAPASPTAPAPSTDTASPTPAHVPSGASAAQAMRALCVQPTYASTEPVAPGETPPDIAEVERQVEQVRGFEYRRPVAVQAITDAEMDAKLDAYFEGSYPKAFYDRRTIAWRTIGVIPQDADLRESLHAFLTGQVVGFYDQETGELVYLGGGDLGLAERFFLSHELTHAIDDQRFDLKRLDRIAGRCRDEQVLAALGAVEGSAQYFATRVLLEFPTFDLNDILSLIEQLTSTGGSPPGVPPFVYALQTWPYEAGLEFVSAEVASGGMAAVDGALRSFPVSTEQILHPERFPSDVPTPVDVPDLASGLGPGFTDLDVMQVGEEWLRAMLRLRLDSGVADAAAAGWDGGVYRAWSDGDRVGGVLRTVWDTPEDARAFVDALDGWLAAGDTLGAADQRGSTVDFRFANDPELLDRLAEATAP